MLSVEQIKRVNLVDFLGQHYGLELRANGSAHACLSPFTQETHPSFFVRMVDGHWVFKDHSSGLGGTIFDFVQMKEKLPDFSATLRHVRGLLGGNGAAALKAETAGEKVDSSGTAGGEQKAADVGALYERFGGEDVSVCRDYLLSRRVSAEVVEQLIGTGLVVHNRYQGRSYCCFAVHDASGALRCLDNHEIGGSGKFVLGRKSVFSLDWAQLPTSETVYVSEGIIDYLSVKTLEAPPVAGLALLGNQLCFEPSLLGRARVIVAAVDDDRGGYAAVVDLQDQYPDCEVRTYPLEGHKDPNELLMALSTGTGRKLSAYGRARLYREYLQAPNKGEVARRWGIDRSTMYEIVRQCERVLKEQLEDKKPGPKPKGRPETLEEAWARIAELEQLFESKATDYERAYCDGEFLKLHLQWAREEAAELRGQQPSRPATQKPHAKKKQKKRR